jgi:hypothetical protein
MSSEAGVYLFSFARGEFMVAILLRRQWVAIFKLLFHTLLRLSILKPISIPHYEYIIENPRIQNSKIQSQLANRTKDF